MRLLSLILPPHVVAAVLAAGSSADCARAASVWAKPAAAKANVRIESLRMNPL